MESVRKLRKHHLFPFEAQHPIAAEKAVNVPTKTKSKDRADEGAGSNTNPNTTRLSPTLYTCIVNVEEMDTCQEENN